MLHPTLAMLACLKTLFFKASVLIIKNLRNVRGGLNNTRGARE